MKKSSSKKLKSSDRPSRNLQDVSPHASLDDIKQRKVLDLRRWYDRTAALTVLGAS